MHDATGAWQMGRLNDRQAVGALNLESAPSSTNPVLGSPFIQPMISESAKTRFPTFIEKLG
jgi:hypothetical protein